MNEIIVVTAIVGMIITGVICFRLGREKGFNESQLRYINKEIAAASERPQVKGDMPETLREVLRIAKDLWEAKTRHQWTEKEREKFIRITSRIESGSAKSNPCYPFQFH